MSYFNKEKSYQCFICGHDFTSYEKFSEHIKSEHVEGKEFIACPKCEAPVRDLRLHFKVKHPGIKLPQNGQMKAQFFYDFSGKKRRKTKKPTFKEGYFISEKNNGLPMHYRSGLELDLYGILENIKEVARYEVEPEDAVVTYQFDGEYHKYHPDLKVIYIDGTVEVWEVKPSSQTDLPMNEAKWDACAEVLSRRNIKFKIKTEKGINRLRKEAIKQLRKE